MAFACVACCAALWALTGRAMAQDNGPRGSAADNQGVAGTAVPTAADTATNTEAVKSSIFGRTVQPGIATDYVIPFDYPDRPTITVTINGATRPLLFDTGTNTCLLQLSQAWALPPCMALTPDASGIAQLEGKRLRLDHDGTLDYAVAPLVKLGGVRLRRVPWRVYDIPGTAAAEYAGAFAPSLLRDWLIEVNNSAAEIRLHQREAWLPPAQACMLPVLSLPRGIFVPLSLEGEQLWFHMDTGFSGGIGLAPEVQARHNALITKVNGEAEAYQGWHADYEYNSLVIREVGLPAYPGLSWAATGPLALSDVPGLSYRDAYRELAGYGIGGIAGSGFWQRFDYVLDYELGRLYLWPRADWQKTDGAQ
jgi:hypothetical protein